MSKTTYTATRVECDRCATTEDTSSSEGRNEWGELAVEYKGQVGGRGYDGSAGGCNYSGKIWFCLACTKDFMAFLDARKKK